MPRVLGDKRGFTLVELLVVVAIIVLLASIVVPNIAGRVTKARMHAAEGDISAIDAALSAYHADFGAYPGDVFPTEDKNNNGKIDWDDADNDGVVDAGESEDRGVDVNNDGVLDYACGTGGEDFANGRLDRGDGVVNILDLKWALKTTAKNGPYIDEIPLDPWDNEYVYYAPFERALGASAEEDYLYLNPATMRDEDGIVTVNGRLGDGEDEGIGQYATTNTQVRTGFTSMWAGADNGILDHGDDDNKDGTLQSYMVVQASPAPQREQALELGNADVSPDGLTRNVGYYVYSVGRNEKDETATGYEDIGGLAENGKPDYRLNADLTGTGGPDLRLHVYLLPAGPAGRFDEDINADGTLDTGYEDTGLDGIPGTKDNGEDDGNLTVGTGTPTPSENFQGPYNTDTEFDIGGDDVNNWNKKRPWRENTSYGG